MQLRGRCVFVTRRPCLFLDTPPHPRPAQQENHVVRQRLLCVFPHHHSLHRRRLYAPVAVQARRRNCAGQPVLAPSRHVLQSRHPGNSRRAGAHRVGAVVHSPAVVGAPSGGVFVWVAVRHGRGAGPPDTRPLLPRQGAEERDAAVPLGARVPVPLPRVHRHVARFGGVRPSVFAVPRPWRRFQRRAVRRRPRLHF